MALTLYILRHAKSDKGGAHIADIDRPLSQRGQVEAREIAALIAARGYAPDHILCSSSQRTRETLTPILAVLKQDTTIKVSRDIYDATLEGLLATIRAQSDDFSQLMIVGHNPGLEQLAQTLAASGDRAPLARLSIMFPPASLAVISFDLTRWAGIGPARGRLDAFEVPSAGHE